MFGRIGLCYARSMRHAPVALLSVLFVGACSSGGGGGTAPPPTAGMPPPAANVEVSELFVLGDSLSDVGNAAAVVDYLLGKPVRPPTVGLCNPTDVLVLLRPCNELFHRRSRVSDGPVAVEHLARYLGLFGPEPSRHLVPSRPERGTNYAVASAKARGQNDVDLAHQVDRLILDKAPLSNEALYVIIIGGNDAIDALQAEVELDVDSDVGPGGAIPPPVETSAEIVESAVDAIAASVERLLDYGARRFIVANVPDLGSLPAVRTGAAATSDPNATLVTASAISDAFTAALEARLVEIENRGQWPIPEPPLILRFDLRVALTAAQVAVLASGGNALDACFDSVLYRDSTAAERVFHDDCAPAEPAAPPGFARFVFWDGIHPTGVAHIVIGDALIAVAADASISGPR